MHGFSSVPFIRILPAFCAGIVCSFYDLVLSVVAFTGFIICFIVILLFLNRRKSDFRRRFLVGMFFQVIFFSLGYLVCDLKDERKMTSHISKHLEKKIFSAVIIESPVDKKGTYRMVADFHSTLHNQQENSIKGKCYIYIRNDSSAASIRAGDRFFFNGTIKEIKAPLNPGDFDFRRYASIQRIYHQVNLEEGDWQVIGSNELSLKRIAADIRNKFLGIYRDAGLSGQEYAVLAALVLGYDDEIGRDIMQAYSATGTLHVLSVSGMHVGLIYTALTFLLAFMERRKELRLARFILLLASLWFYAMLTGLSSPVMRSAMMFSFILLGNSFNRTINIYNSLSLSAICIFILFDPFMLMETGFQLSYIAVAGIAYLFSKIYNLCYFRNYIIDKAWSLISVSIAAQVATLGISLYYFHQFPNYFIPANLLIIPLSTVGIFGGIILLFLYPFKVICTGIGWLLSMLVHFLNESALAFQELPGAVWNGITINVTEAVLIYVFFILLIRFLLNKSSANYFAATITVCLFLLSFAIRNNKYSERKNILVFSGTAMPCYQYNKGFHSWLLFHRIDSVRALKLSDNYCLVEDLPVSNRKLIIIEDLKNERSNMIFKFKHYVFIEDNIIADYTSEKENQIHSGKKEKLSFINRSLFNKSAYKKLHSENIAVEHKVRREAGSQNIYLTIHYLNEGAFTIDL